MLIYITLIMQREREGGGRREKGRKRGRGGKSERKGEGERGEERESVNYQSVFTGFIEFFLLSLFLLLILRDFAL